ncbi:MAG: LysR family transcriptional regulator [Chitinophagaceae bacterium]|nr:LysR family transcriptional regulator [Chitinophagaceae bacterium]
MELRQLKYTIAIADELHFGNAAKRLFVSQPALSQQIQLLEKELGIEIFKRSKRSTHKKVELTEAGSVFVLEAKRILQSIEKMTDTVRRIGTHHRSVKLGVYKLLMRDKLISMIKLFTEKFPDIEIKIAEYTTYKEVQEALLNDNIDLGITLLPLLSNELSSKLYQKNYLHILLPQHHKLAKEPSLHLSQLKNEKWVELEKRATPVLEMVEAVCKKNGINRQGNIIQEVSSFELVASLVGLGLGIAFVPSTLDASYIKGVVKKKILNEDNSRFTDFEYKQVFAYKKSNESPSVNALMELTEKA